MAQATSEDGLVAFTQLADREADSPTLFTEIDSKASGIDFINPLDPQHLDRRLYHSAMACGGIAVGDVNGDRLADLYFTSGPLQNRLYLQEGTLRFSDATEAAGLHDFAAWSTGASLVDIDNDRDLDIYVCNYDAPNRLFLNDGSGNFREAAAEFNLDLVDASLVATFCDYDADGDLDLYLLTNRYYRRGGRPRNPPVDTSTNPPRVLPEFKKYYGFKKIGPSHFGVDSVGRPDRLLRQEADGTFHDVTEAAGISGGGHGLSATWWDFDGDGWNDLYVANDFDDPDRLYRNNGDGTFTDILYKSVPHTPWFSMGGDVADVDGNGWLDLMVADMSPRSHFKRMTTMGAVTPRKLAEVSGPPAQFMRNTLFLNTGTGSFWEAAELAGLASTDWTWAVMLEDFDNDRRPDVLITNGISRNFNNNDVPITPPMLVGKSEWDIHEHLPSRPERNLAFRNLGELRFQDVSREWGFDRLGMSYAAVRSDLDRDGDLDLVVANLDEKVTLYRNDSSDGNSLLLRLHGTSSNRFGLGAKVSVRCQDEEAAFQLNPYKGFLASNEPVLHVGLGDHTVVDRIVVHWPDRTRQELEDVPANLLVDITEPPGSAAEASTSPPSGSREQSPWFLRSDRTGNFRHQERSFDDFSHQQLLPRRMSRLGPGVCVADYDGDGDDDVFVGGAAGEPARLLVANDKEFEVADVPGFLADRGCEDMGALWFDADGDDDLDLYVVSGGVEFGDDTSLLLDRLYLNQGPGGLQRAPAGTLPDLRDSGSAVVAADYDRDGDLDLFVGARLLPGQYPASPQSRLLQNTEGRFKDVTARVAPQLAQCGMVTGGLWTDVDGDRWMDLLVTTDWGPVRFFRNERGKLQEETSASGLASHTGWWNGISGCDLDRDGDIDYVATNFGDNTRYHPSKEEPILLFYGDFGGNGKKSLVEATYQDQKLLPLRDKFAVDKAIPWIGDRFATHEQYAEAELAEIYSTEALRNAQRFEARTLRTSALLNDGQGRFKVRPLPRLAQLSPSFGVEISDWNGDGVPDVYLVGNCESGQVTSGPMHGGVSLLLVGKGDGRFEVVPPHTSGLNIPGDAKSLASGDFAGDRQSEFVVGVNDGPLVCYRPNPKASIHQGLRLLEIELIGPAGNRTAIGAQVVLHASDGSQQMAEVYAGHGYLSQSSPVLRFGSRPSTTIDRVQVHWPDGTESITEVTEELRRDGRIEIESPRRRANRTSPGLTREDDAQ